MFNQILEGHWNELMKKENELYDYRMAICKKCPLLKETIFGLVCSDKVYINPKTNEISDIPEIGFINGCGCRMEAKVRVPSARCNLNKW